MYATLLYPSGNRLVVAECAPQPPAEAVDEGSAMAVCLAHVRVRAGQSDVWRSVYPTVFDLVSRAWFRIPLPFLLVCHGFEALPPDDDKRRSDAGCRMSLHVDLRHRVHRLTLSPIDAPPAAPAPPGGERAFSLSLFRWTVPRLTTPDRCPVFQQLLPTPEWYWLWRDVLRVVSGDPSIYTGGAFLFRGSQRAAQTFYLLYSTPSVLFVVVALAGDDPDVMQHLTLSRLRRFFPLALFLPDQPNPAAAQRIA